MKVTLLKSTITQKGWIMPLFCTKTFQLKINEFNEVEMEAKSGYIGLNYIVNAMEINVKIKIDDESQNISYMMKLGENIIEIENSHFYGDFYFILSKEESLILQLENKNRFEPITFLSREAAGENIRNVKNMNFFKSRITFEGNRYFVNEDYKTTWSIFNVKESFLPSGWERKMVGHRSLYINHNLKTTQWTHPTVSDVSLRNKLEDTAAENVAYGAMIGISFRSLDIAATRKFLVESTGIHLLSNYYCVRKNQMKVIFTDEIGQDFGAIRKEYIYELGEELISDARFTIENDKFVDVVIKEIEGDPNMQEFKPYKFLNDAAKYETPSNFYKKENEYKNNLPDDLFFTLVGIYLAILVLYNESTRFSFSLGFLENILKLDYTIRHVQDEEFQRSLLWILNNPPDDNVVPGITEENKRTKISQIVKENLYSKRMWAYKHIRNGFYQIMPKEFKFFFTAEELAQVLSTEEMISIASLKDHVAYIDCNEDVREIKWLWEILEEKDQEYIRKFMQFVTGSGTLPRLRLNINFKIYIEKTRAHNVLIAASACHKRMHIGVYDSKNKMEEILDFSILNSTGFHKI